MSPELTLIECPRDAMQGWPNLIPTEKKVAYLNQLLRVGFDVLDFGSFVSHQAIPQMADTKEVLASLDLDGTTTRLLAIVANTRGAEDAAVYPEIDFLGFPFSISETFQLRNTNKTISQSFNQVREIQDLCAKRQKRLVIYLSMGFGNPYGDPFSVEIVHEWFEKMVGLGVQTIALSDTVGIAEPEKIRLIFSKLSTEFPQVEIGAHFHSRPEQWLEKVEAAFETGCTRFDSAIKGIGGCPMAEDELVGNIATENVIQWANAKGMMTHLNLEEFRKAATLANEIFA